jgi:putative tricarboxylic transport membrane protein
LKHPDLKSGFFFLLISIFVSIESFRVGIGKWNVPGPGFVPFWAGVVLGCLALSLIAYTIYSRPAPPSKNWYKEVLWGRWFITIVSILVYAILLEYLGFIICTFILLNLLIIVIKPQQWKMAIIISITATGGAYFLFQIWLKAQLPKGFLGF